MIRAMEILNPVPSAPPGTVSPLAPRPRDLRGKRIGNADALLGRVAELLVERAGAAEIVIVGPEHARTIADSGWSKADLKRALWEHGRVRMDAFSAENVARYRHIIPGRFDATEPGATVTPTLRAEDIMVIVAGGPGKHSSIVPTFGATRSVTARIE